MADVLPCTAIRWLMKQGVSLAEISESTGLARSTIYRIVWRGSLNNYFVKRRTREVILNYYRNYRDMLAEDKRVREEAGL